MPSFSTIILSILIGAVVLAAAYIYLFGIPPEVKREIEEKAIETMGENKASSLLRDQIGKVPTSDQEDVKDIRETLGGLGDGKFKNPLDQ